MPDKNTHRKNQCRGLSFLVFGLFSRFKRDRDGNVAIIVAFASVPILIGIAVSYNIGQTIAARKELQDAADAAALAAAKGVNNALVEGAGTSSQTDMEAVAGTLVQQSLAANRSTFTTAPESSFSVNTLSQYTVSVTVNLTTQVSSVMPSFLGGGNNIISVASTATMSPGSAYFQILFVVDVSNSMGVGGDEDNINQLINYQQCAFACHDPNGYSHKTTSCVPSGSGWKSCDRRTVARQYGIKLKIDYVNQAVQSFLSKLQDYSSDTRMNSTIGIYTFGYSFNQLLPPTSDLTAALTAATSIDIENVTDWRASMGPSYNYGYTYTTKSLTSILNALSDVGDGSSTTSKKTFVVFLSDGLEDVPGSSAWGRATGTDYATVCTAIKNAGARVFSILAPYYPILSGSEAPQYQALVAPFASTGSGSMQYAMQNCASSDGDFFLASDGDDIQSAFQQALGVIVADVGLRLLK